LPKTINLIIDKNGHFGSRTDPGRLIITEKFCHN